MRHLAAAALAALLLGACAAAPVAEAPALRTIELQNAGFEAEPLPRSMSLCAPKWECSAHADPTSFTYHVDDTQAAAGARSLRIERVRNEPWGLIAQSVRDPALRGARVRFSLSVRMEGATGNGVGPYLHFHDGSGRGLGHVKNVSKEGAWKRLSVEFVVPETTYLVEAGAVLEGGGKAWVDEARLEVLAAPPAKKPG